MENMVFNGEHFQIPHEWVGTPKEMEVLDSKDARFKMLRRSLKNLLHQYCINNICIYREILGYDSWMQISNDEYILDGLIHDAIEDLAKHFHMWNYIEDKMEQYRMLVWDVVGKYTETSEDDVIYSFVTEDLFEYMWNHIWSNWSFGSNTDDDEELPQDYES